VGNLKKINLHLPGTTELFKHKAPGATFYAMLVIMHWEAWMDVSVHYAQKFNIFVQW
jgi:hypothetical protein